MNRSTPLLSSLLVLALTACGPKAAGPAGHAGPAGPAAGGAVATAALPDVPFDDLNHEQRAQYMKERVMPAMAPIFRQHDPAEFAEFTCKTCHGPGAADGDFEMPNAGLPKLDFADLSAYKPADLEWMGKEVKPAMAKLLGRPAMDPANPDPKAFGCLGCHTAK